MTITVHELLEAHRSEVIKMVDKIVMRNAGLVESDFEEIHKRIRSRSTLITSTHQLYAGRWIFTIEINNVQALVHIPKLQVK